MRTAIAKIKTTTTKDTSKPQRISNGTTSIRKRKVNRVYTTICLIAH